MIAAAQEAREVHQVDWKRRKSGQMGGRSFSQAHVGAHQGAGITAQQGVMEDSTAETAARGLLRSDLQEDPTGRKALHLAHSSSKRILQQLPQRGVHQQEQTKQATAVVSRTVQQDSHAVSNTMLANDKSRRRQMAARWANSVHAGTGAG